MTVQYISSQYSCTPVNRQRMVVFSTVTEVAGVLEYWQSPDQ